MDLIVDHNKFKKIIASMPECEPFLGSKTEGFKHLYAKVFLPLLNNGENAKLSVDVSLFDFDDLVHFSNYLFEKCDTNANNPVIILENAFGKLPPVAKKMNFI
jgi:hypothetical protein